ncbi:hypothetical protein [Bradyrhizobium brasilense]|uniref:Peptidase M48 domain-containing protein n=1 Tax=Bradyrhizobium brasilense TaxID=1419277 RepID=A0ABY8J6U0_9BRAD|nr:hypothetical protein [Bradyrhizobium brasilense]WFU61267.1 hypothetical protein QA636_27605 [Bradyrhizobium brasilense]
MYRNAEDFIRQRREHLGILDWFLQLVPKNVGGSNLEKLPGILRVQLKILERFSGERFAGPLREQIPRLLQLDWAAPHFRRLASELPSELREQFALSDRFAVGAVYDSDFNGEVLRLSLREGIGYAVILPAGLFMLLSFAAELQMMAAARVVRDVVIHGSVKRYFGTESYFTCLRRSIRARRRSELRQRQVAEEFEILLRRFVDLGAIDPPDLVRGAVIPLTPFGRAGHSLEAGSYLRLAALDFILLHECGHIALNHFDPPSEPSSIFNRELEADGWALATGLRAASESDSKIASLLGAWFFLALADRIEHAQGTASYSTHPPAAERMLRLNAFVDHTDLLDEPTRSRVLACLSSLADSVTWAQQDISTFRIALSRSNALELFLDWCARRNEPDRFKDQIPRWILQGAPQSLCDSLAAAQLHATEQLAEQPDDALARMKLDLVNWVFEGAKQSGSVRLIELLDGAVARAQRMNQPF